jgi:outer membrane protein assembly factor BamB
MLTGASATVFGQEWPQWRGPNRDGSMSPSSTDAQWPEKLKGGWKVSVGEGHSSPVVSGGHVYQFARVGEREVVAAYDVSAGRKLWESAYSAPYEMNPAATDHGKGPKSTPLLAGGKLYAFGMSGVLSCLDASSGKLVWKYDSAGQWKRTSPTFGISMSPVLVGGAVVAHVGADKDGALTAFDAATGKVRWQWKGEGPGYSSPVLMKNSLVTFSSERLVAVDASTGALDWEMPFSTPYTQNAVTPLVLGDVLIYGGLSHPMTAVRINGRKPEKLWDNRDAGMYMSSPVMAAGLLHGLTNRNKGQFVSVDLKSGKTVWTSDGRQGDNAALVTQGDAVLALTTDAELHVMKASARGLAPVRKYTVANSPTWAHPVVLGTGRVLVKDKESLALWTA